MDSGICLTCLCIPGKAHNINEIVLENLKILEILQQLVPLILEQKAFTLPNRICAKCLEKLLISYKFQEQCLNSLQNLHKLWLDDSSIRIKKQKASRLKTDVDENEFQAHNMRNENTIGFLPELEQDVKIPFDEISINKERDDNRCRGNHLKHKEDAEGTLNVKIHSNEDSSSKNLREKIHSEDVEEVAVVANQCKLCNKIFKRSQGLASHMSKIHFKKYLYQCQKCEKGFSVEEPFIRHCNRHLGIKPFPCTQCDKAFETNDILNKHLVRHSKEPSGGKKSYRIEVLKQHILRRNIERSFQCPKCVKNFKNFSDHIKHIKTHKKRKCNDNKIAECLTTPNQKIILFKPDLEQSNDKIKHKSSIHEEKNCEHKITMNTPNENEEEENMEDTKVLVTVEESVNLEKINVNLDENKSGVQPKSTQDNVDEQEKKYQPTKCDLCNQLFKNPQGLARHRSSTHFKKHVFQCDQCERGFSVEEYYIKHRNRHLGIKTFKCNQCDKAFETNSILNQHLISHSKLTPHLCTTCGKSFRRIDGLRQHMKRHGEERPFKCSVCPKSFKCLSDKLKHMRIHDEKRHERYECNICGARLATLESLSNHQMIHTGEKPFKCRHCDKRFICAVNMKTHERIHTGEKPYKCQYCWKSFRQSYDRKKHTKRMHKNEINTNCE